MIAERISVGSKSALIFVALGALVCCATPAQKAKQAYEQGNYKLAVDYYKGLFERENITNPQTYRFAAKAALKEGSLSLTEKYYNRALRNGGGPQIARELAKFYIQTSNYASAIRLFQYLLETETEKQPIYNNLGTALMYAERPLAAETYMLIAQEMNPEDPVPYLNLGLLYDKHLNQKPLALQFYHCFLKIGSKSKQISRVRARIKQLRGQYGDSMPRQFECGSAYVATTNETKNVDPEIKKLQKRIQAAQNKRNTTETNRTVTLTFGENSKSSENMTSVERRIPKPSSKVKKSKKNSTSPSDQESGETNKPPDKSEGKGLYKAANKHFKSGDYNRVIQKLSDAPLSQLDYRTKRLYGLAQNELGNSEEAIRWLEWSVDEKITLSALEPLLKLYSQKDLNEKREQMCRQLDDYDLRLKKNLSCP